MTHDESDARSKGRLGPLEKLEGNPLERLADAVRDQEMIVVCGGGWENVELLDRLANSIPRTCKVVELKPAGVEVQKDALPPDYMSISYNKSLAEITATTNIAGDYLIVPDMRFHDLKVFQQIAQNFKGGIMVGIVDAFFMDPETFPLIADVLVKTFNRDRAPLGIGEVWARPNRASELIPPQGPGPHFTLSSDLRIALAPPEDIDDEGNNFARIRQLLPPIRQAAADLAGNLNPNLHPELARIAAQYLETLGSGSEAVPWSLLFGLGVRLQNAASAADRNILDQMREPLEDAVQEALDSVLTLHGPLILATKEGRELIEDAERLRLTRDQQAALREDAQTIAYGLKNFPEVIQPPAAMLAAEAAAIIGEDPHPERGTVFGLAMVRNIATIILPAATLATVGAVVSVYLGGGVGGVVGTGAGAVGTMAMRESERVKLAAKALGAGYDRLLERGDQAMIDGLQRLTPFRRLVIALEEPLRRYAEITQSRWVLRLVDFIMRTDSEES